MSNLSGSQSLVIKILVMTLLLVSSASAYYVGDLLSWTGIAYYSICAVAIFKDYHKAHIMLWAAVGVHSILVGYSMLNWFQEGIEPCPYCFTSAGCILIAATVRTKPAAVVLPAVLVFSVAYSWTWLFAPKISSVHYTPPVQQIQAGQAEVKVDDKVSSVPEKKTEAETLPSQELDLAAQPEQASPTENGHAPGELTETAVVKNTYDPEQQKTNATPALEQGKTKTDSQTEPKPTKSTSTNQDKASNSKGDEKAKSG